VARLCQLAAALSLAVAVLAGPAVGAHASDSEVYVVKTGDSLASIAANLEVGLGDLLRLNNLTVSSLIVPGQHLKIPPTASHRWAGAPAGSGHTVTTGETLSGIAAHYGVSLTSLLAANHLTATSLIVPGQRLALPAAAASAPTSSAPTTSAPTSSGSTGSGHTVGAGETLSGIAAHYGVSLTSLLAANHLTATSLIVPGQRLALPAGADPPSATTSGSISVVIDYALAQLGKPYRFFTSGPDRFDCSGLTMAAYARVGISLVHYSAYQARQGRAVDFLHTSIQPGDLVFLDTNGDGAINHVGMAINATTWVQAPGPGDIVRLGALPPKGLIVAVRRYIPAG
jgi:LysM repeat protein